MPFPTLLDERSERLCGFRHWVRKRDEEMNRTGFRNPVGQNLDQAAAFEFVSGVVSKDVKRNAKAGEGCRLGGVVILKADLRMKRQADDFLSLSQEEARLSRSVLTSEKTVVNEFGRIGRRAEAFEIGRGG